MKSLYKDVFILVFLLAAGIYISIFFSVRPLTSAFLFFLSPTLYLLYSRPQNLYRILAGSTLFGVLFGFGFDFVALSNNAWSEPSSQLFFPNRIFGVIAADHIVWFFLWTLVIITFYEHFLEHDRSNNLSPRYILGVAPAAILNILTILVYYISPETLRFHYAYLVLGVLASLPLTALLVRRPLFVGKLAKTIPYFFSLFLSYELTALYLSQWTFPGQYIGTLSIMGLQFPVEEFFFWIFLSSPVILSYYEIFVDDLE